MEILCISDSIDSLVYSNSLKERFGHVDAVISCGDLKRDYYEYIVSTLNKPFLYVLGNHSQFSIKPYTDTLSDMTGKAQNENLFSGGILVDGKSIYLKKFDLIVAGFGGAIRYNRGENQYTEKEMLWRIIKIVPRLVLNRIIHGRYIDILITHAPPRHINDREDPCHHGFKIFRWFIKTFKPSYMVHGHIHLYNNTSDRSSSYLGTTVINTYKHYLLKFPGEYCNNEQI